MIKEFVIRYRITLMLVAFLLVGEGGGAAGGQVSFEILETPGTSQWADFSLSRDGKSMGCLLGGAVYWWTTENGFRFLDPGIATQGGVGMAADGGSLIAAKAGHGGALPAIWYRDGSSVELGIMPGNCDMDHLADGGFDINSDGTVAVGQTASCSAEIAFVWTPQGGLHGLPVIGKADSRGMAVSADGRTVVGFCEHPDKGFRRPALWNDGSGPILFLGPNRAGEAMNISLNGRYIVGQADLGGLSPQAFARKGGSEPVNLGNLSGRATDTSQACGVSDDGKVVGWSGDALWGEQEAFIWTENRGMLSLADYLATHDIELPPGVILTGAMDISGDGATVIGICRDRDWNQRYWLIHLGDSLDSYPVAETKSWEPKPLVPLISDSLDTFQADMLNPFPFGKRRFAPAP
jgi:probable HAF family extracellular repeat protein